MNLNDANPDYMLYRHYIVTITNIKPMNSILTARCMTISPLLTASEIEMTLLVDSRL